MKRASVQPLKFDPKPEAISSLVLGFLSVIAGLTIIIHYLQSESGVLPYDGGQIIEIIVEASIFWGWLVPLLGIALGIMGLKSVKKKLAIVGIVLSFLGLVTYVFLGYTFEFISYAPPSMFFR